MQHLGDITKIDGAKVSPVDVWQKCNGEGTALWASEVEEFAIAVTKKHFQEDKQE